MMIVFALAVTAINLPENPVNGLAMDKAGAFYMVKPSADGKTSTLVKYSLVGARLKPAFSYPQTFGTELDILPNKNGIIVVDYNPGYVYAFNSAAKLLWKTKAQSANAAKIDANGNVWFCLLSGSLAWKTQQSSTLEPILDQSGGELFIPGLFDLAPGPRGGFYALSEANSVVFVSAKQEVKRLAQRKQAQRILESRLGGVLVFETPTTGQQIAHVSDSGIVKIIWKATKDMPAFKHFSRAGTGKLLLAAPNTRGGVAYIIDPEATNK